MAGGPLALRLAAVTADSRRPTLPDHLGGSARKAAPLRSTGFRLPPRHQQHGTLIVHADAGAASAVVAAAVPDGQPDALDAAALQQLQQQQQPAAPPPAAHRQRRGRTSLVWLVGGLAAAAALGAAHLALSRQSAALLPMLETLRAAVAGSPLAQSGFFAAFSLIFLSEVGRGGAGGCWRGVLGCQVAGGS